MSATTEKGRSADTMYFTHDVLNYQCADDNLSPMNKRTNNDIFLLTQVRTCTISIRCLYYLSCQLFVV